MRRPSFAAVTYFFRSLKEEKRITGANERHSTEFSSAKMIEIDVLLPFHQGCKEKKKKSMIISIDSSEGVGVITVHYNGPAV